MKESAGYTTVSLAVGPVAQICNLLYRRFSTCGRWNNTNRFGMGTVCRLDVEPGKQATFVRSGKDEADLYVRLNNSTRLLNTAEAIEYVRSRWR